MGRVLPATPTPGRAPGEPTAAPAPASPPRRPTAPSSARPRGAHAHAEPAACSSGSRRPSAHRSSGVGPKGSSPAPELDLAQMLEADGPGSDGKKRGSGGALDGGTPQRRVSSGVTAKYGSATRDELLEAIEKHVLLLRKMKSRQGNAGGASGGGGGAEAAREAGAAELERLRPELEAGRAAVAELERLRPELEAGRAAAAEVDRLRPEVEAGRAVAAELDKAKAENVKVKRLALKLKKEAAAATERGAAAGGAGDEAAARIVALERELEEARRDAGAAHLNEATDRAEAAEARLLELQQQVEAQQAAVESPDAKADPAAEAATAARVGELEAALEAAAQAAAAQSAAHAARVAELEAEVGAAGDAAADAARRAELDHGAEPGVGPTARVAELEAALEAAAQAAAAQSVTHAARVAELEAEVTAAGEAAAAERDSALDAAADAARRAGEGYGAELEAANAARAAAEAELSALREAQGAAAEGATGIEAECAGLRRQVQDLDIAKARLETQHAVLEQELQTARASLTEATAGASKTAILDLELADYKRTAETLNGRLQQFQEQIRTHKERAAADEMTIRGLEERLEQDASHRSKDDDNRERLKALMLKAKKDLAEKRVLLDEQRKEMAEQVQQLELRTQEVETLKTEAAELTVALDAATAEGRTARNDHEVALQSGQFELDTARREATDLSTKLADTQSEFERYKARAQAVSDAALSGSATRRAHPRALRRC